MASIDTDSLREEISALLATHDDEHQHERALARTQWVFDLFYDDQDEPDVAIRDALTDLMHISAHRGVDLEQAFARALRSWRTEREEWGLDDPEEPA